MTRKDQKSPTAVLGEEDPVASAEQVADGRVDQETYFKAVEQRAKRLVNKEARRVRRRLRLVSRSG
jgi:hypothetical protein